MKSSRRGAFSVSGIAAWAVTTGLLSAVLTGLPPAQAQTAAPIWTPYEKNPSIFHNLQEAIEALRSPDILRRRSGIEWLSDHAEIYNNVSFPLAFELETRQQIKKRPDLVPDLARAVREMPLQNSQQAARLLVVMGAPAHTAIPTVCAALVNQTRINVVQGYEMQNSLVHLCGGPSKVAPTLIALMKNPEPATRSAAAGAAGLFNDIGFTSGLPALTQCVDDPFLAVRLAAVRSLEALTYNSSLAPWQKTLPSLARALASPDLVLRQTAARTLALVPADTSPVAAALRKALHGSDTVSVSYVVTALAHAAWSDPNTTLDAFLPDLKSTNLEQRRRAAADIYRAEGALWSSRRQAGYEPIPDEHGNSNNAYDSRQMSWSLDVDEGIPSAQRLAKIGWRRTAVAAAQSRLLAGLVQATSDPDHAVRTDATRSLEEIGEWTYSGLESGSRPNPAVEARPQVIRALGEASQALRWYEPLLSSSLRELQARVTRGPDGAA